jgi:hypothetical protein
VVLTHLVAVSPVLTTLSAILLALYILQAAL